MKATLEKQIWISGINPVRETLRAENVRAGELVIARSDPRGLELEELARAKSIQVTRSTRERVGALAGHPHHQGVALKMEEFPYSTLEDILLREPADRDPLLLLDSIQDPHNLGAILRSACFLGGRGVIIPRDRSARVSAAVIKTAAGATAYVPVARITNATRALNELKEAGYWIAGLEMEGSTVVYEADLTVPLCLVVGNEQKGIRPLVRSVCDMLVRIPASGPIDSLNAASAATVVLAEVQRQRLNARK
ncbi:MAG: 23S rRNA (guanosine(2251)-2'-O)-methyltransferase RlmB [Desulfobacteraceae bacterium]|nr:23S rRNA (guanosine(2251)-2'-O)-methyltransferase RlmB [Desulfobacteraceae bacterium]